MVATARIAIAAPIDAVLRVYKPWSCTHKITSAICAYYSVSVGLYTSLSHKL